MIDAWSPFEIADVPLRNRVFVSAHTTNFGEAEVNQVGDRLIDYWRARARGGIALGITEGLRVHPTSLRRLGLEIYSDESVPGYRALVDAMHEEGAAMFAQLLHSGRHVQHERLGSWGASNIPWALGEPVPHVLNLLDIDELVNAFGASARRAGESGFDGLELHIGHGHLLQQFLSPATNRRDDDYGGDRASRLRLTRRVMQSIRDKAPKTPLGLRVSGDEFMEGGLTADDTLEIVHSLHKEFDLAFLHVSQSAYAAHPSLSTQIPDMGHDSAPYRHLPRFFKKSLPDIPILAIGRIDNLDVANSLLEAGDADMVGMTRAHIAEPAILNKSRHPRAESGRSRSCIACNQGCLERVAKNLPLSCVVNPEVGFEREWASLTSQLESSTKSEVLVVGGGPAGLEAASTAARYGHSVTLIERGDRWGGAVQLAGSLVGRERQLLLVNELVEECAEAGVEDRKSVV